VDFVIADALRLTAIEVKSGPSSGKLGGLTEFVKQHPTGKPLLIGAGGIELPEFRLAGALAGRGMRPDVNNFKAPADHLPLVRSARQRQQDDTLSSPEPLSHYRNIPAWVLLADPGAGKTDTFKTLCAAEGGYYTTARDFVELHLAAAPSGSLFIDGLDEMTAGHAAGQTVLGQIRTKLQQLGTASFRLPAGRQIGAATPTAPHYSVWWATTTLPSFIWRR
jgi:hypothetical protein